MKLEANLAQVIEAIKPTPDQFRTCGAFFWQEYDEGIITAAINAVVEAMQNNAKVKVTE